MIFYFSLYALVLGSCGFVARADNVGPSDCHYQLVETNPKGMESDQQTITGSLSPSIGDIHDTANVFLDMFQSAKKSIKVASFYWSLTTDDHMIGLNEKFSDPHESQKVGLELFDSLRQAAEERQVKIEIVNDSSMRSGKSISYSNDLGELEKFALVHYVNMTRLFGTGILHSKFIIVDDKDFYLGSANMDWRSLTQVKEFGLYVQQCPSLTADLERVFNGYKQLTTSINNGGTTATMNLIQVQDRNNLRLKANEQSYSENSWFRPMMIQMNNITCGIHLAAAPRELKGLARSYDLDSIVLTIKQAQKFVYLTAMDYQDITRFMEPRNHNWSLIHNVLVEARKQRNVDVRILVDRHYMNERLARKLKDANIKYKGFLIPKYNDFQKNLLHSRIYHSKYIVTDKAVIVTTQNLTPEYFTNTIGASLVIKKNEMLVGQMKNLFERDFDNLNSQEFETH